MEAQAVIVPQYIALSVAMIVAVVSGFFFAQRKIGQADIANDPNNSSQAGKITALVIVSVISLGIVYFPDSLRRLNWMAPVWYDLNSVTIRYCVFAAIIAFLLSRDAFMAVMVEPSAKLKPGLALLVIAIGIPYLLSVLSAPLAPNLGSLEKNNLVMQTSGSSCAAAAGANIARAMGLMAEEKEMAMLMGTTLIGGTLPGQVIAGMAKKGIECAKMEAGAEYLASLDTPAMLFVDHPKIGQESHAVAFAGVEDGKLVILDSWAGKKLVTLKQVNGFWHGKMLVCKKGRSQP